jgi:guanylate kinase
MDSNHYTEIESREQGVNVFKADLMRSKAGVTDAFCRERPPLLVVISGPSGVGKDSVVQRMKERGFPFHFVVTATDRAPRPHEVHGEDYYFYTTPEFHKMIDAGEMLEHAVVYGQLKGIPRAHVRQALASGQDVVMRLDVQGAATIQGMIAGAITVFLVAESEEELIGRLRERRTESDDALQRRVEMVRAEMELVCNFDYVVLNRSGALDSAVDDVAAIIRAEHCRTVPRRIEL